MHPVTDPLAPATADRCKADTGVRDVIVSPHGDPADPAAFVALARCRAGRRSPPGAGPGTAGLGLQKADVDAPLDLEAFAHPQRLHVEVDGDDLHLLAQGDGHPVRAAPPLPRGSGRAGRPPRHSRARSMATGPRLRSGR